MKPNNIKCKLCGQICKNLISLANHSTRTHNLYKEERLNLYPELYPKPTTQYDCELCGESFNKYGFSSHISRTHKLKRKDYYDKYLRKENEGICPICKAETEFLGITTGYRTTCSSNCASLYGIKCSNSKYGVDNISQVPKIKAKMKKSIKQSWDNLSSVDRKQRCANISIGTKEHSAEVYDILNKQLRQFEIDNDCVQVQTIYEQFGTGWAQIKLIDDRLYYKGRYFIKRKDISKIEEYCTIHKLSGKSHPEKKLLDFCKSLYKGTIQENKRSIIYPYELDIYFPDLNLAIEYNGTYWHSIENKSKYYHQEKSKLCMKKDIRLIHIYEWELKEPYWNNTQLVLKKALNKVKRLSADKCNIRKISNNQYLEFLNAFNIYSIASVVYGLFYKNNLVHIIGFDLKESIYNTKGYTEWQIIYNCSKYNIIGGTERLFNHFLNKYKPEIVYGYCDFNKYDGENYKKLGMKLMGYTQPDKYYVVDGKSMYPKPHNIKEDDYMLVYGAGKIRYKYQKRR